MGVAIMPENNKTINDVTQLIKDAIAATAARKGNAGIKTVEDMIPKMDPSHYPNRRYLDLQYADISDDAKLDIFLPDEGDGPFPVFIEVHGGGWYFGQKRSIEFEPFLLGLKRGYAVVSMGYTLSPKARYPQAIEEIKAGIRFLKANAEKYHLDPNRIAMWGGSAGAHLAGLAAMSCGTGKFENYALGYQGFTSDVQALVLWYGCFDYYTDSDQRAQCGFPPSEDGHWVYQNFLGYEDVEAHPDLLKEMNPETHITQKAPPTFFQHGMSDTVVPYPQSVSFADKLAAVIGQDKVEIELIEGFDHADAGLFAEANMEKVYDFVDKYLKK